ncbi:hypothetical protein AcW1_009625 [Taiwanofungus camphoratus]|nr:hypothetical protein AcW1_009625 [Antrodia cinnamomea]
MPHKRAKRSVREQQRSQSGLNLPPSAKHDFSNEDIPKSVARVLNAAKIQEEFKAKKRRLKGDDHDEDQARPVRKKRKKQGTDDESHLNNVGAGLKILPGESVAHFNRRVEDSMRSVVRTAMKTSSALARKARKEEDAAKSTKPATKPAVRIVPQAKKEDGAPREAGSSTLAADVTANTKSRPAQGEERPKDFQRLSTSAPRRLNDIVQAPPELKKLPRGAKARPAQDSTRDHGEGSGTTLKQGVLSMAQKVMLEEERERAVRMYREMKKAKAGG